MASYIPKDFQPRPEDYQAQGVSQIPRDFLDVVVTPEFVEYWTELRDRGLKKGKKDAWYTTWRNRARFLWAKRGPAWEENRHKYRQAGGERKDLFDTMLDKINGSSRHSGEAAPDEQHKRDMNSIGAAAPINGSGADAVSRYKTQKVPADPAAATMDPLEALKEMKKILKVG